MTPSIRVLSAPVALGIALFTMCGCACRGTDLIAAGKVTAELRIDRALRAPPDICAEDGELVVSGRLARGAPAGPGSHVDVEVIDPSGTTLSDARLNYKAAPTSTHEWSGPKHGVYRGARTRYGSYGVYAVRFPGLPPEGSVIKVRHEHGPQAPATPEPSHMPQP